MRTPTHAGDEVWSPKWKEPKTVVKFVLAPQSGEGKSLNQLARQNAAAVLDNGRVYPLEELTVLHAHEILVLKGIEAGKTVPQLKQEILYVRELAVAVCVKELRKRGFVRLISGTKYAGVYKAIERKG